MCERHFPRYVAPNGLAMALISDKEYPMRVAFQFMAEVTARAFFPALSSTRRNFSGK